MGELQQPQHHCSKVSLSPCHGGFCKLPHSHETQSLVDYLRTHHDWNHLGVGYDGDNQQQHILIVIPNPLHKTKVWDGYTPSPLSLQQPTQGLNLQGKVFAKLSTYTRHLIT